MVVERILTLLQLTPKIIRMVTKSTDGVAGGWFVNHERDYDFGLIRSLTYINYMSSVVGKSTKIQFIELKYIILSGQFLVNSTAWNCCASFGEKIHIPEGQNLSIDSFWFFYSKEKTKTHISYRGWWLGRYKY